MRIISVQVGQARTMTRGAYKRTTGIAKSPVDHIVVTADGVEDDAIISTEHHGGPGQAVYAYARSDYAHFESMLGVQFEPGSFGENVTVDEWPHDPIRIGDEFAAGEVVLQVTSPRVPCATFASRIKELIGEEEGRGWVRTFTAARRPGWYCRVLQPGTLRAGQECAVTPAPQTNLTGLEFGDLMMQKVIDHEDAYRALLNPIDDRSRARLSG